MLDRKPSHKPITGHGHIKMESSVRIYKVAILVVLLIVSVGTSIRAQNRNVIVEVDAEDRLHAILNGATEVKHYLNLESLVAGVSLNARREGDTIALTFTTPTYVRSYRIKGQELAQLMEYLGSYEEILSHDDPIDEVARRYPGLAGIVYPHDCSQEGSEIIVITWDRDTIRGNLMALGTDVMVLSHHRGGMRLKDTLIVVPYGNVRLVSNKERTAEDKYLATLQSNAEQVVNAIAAYLQARPVYESCMPPEVRALIAQPYQYNLDELLPDSALSKPVSGFRLSLLGQVGLMMGDFSVKIRDSVYSGSYWDVYSLNYSFGGESFVRPSYGGTVAGAFALGQRLDLSFRVGVSQYHDRDNSSDSYALDVRSVGGQIVLAHLFGRPDYAGYLSGGGTIGVGVGLMYTSTHVNAMLPDRDGDYSRNLVLETETAKPYLCLIARDQLRLVEQLFLIGEVSATYVWPTNILDEIRYTEAKAEHVVTTTFVTPAQFAFNIGIGLEYAF